MAKVYLDSIYSYPEDDKYSLAYSLGRELLDYLGEDIFCLLLDSRVLINSSIFLSDNSWKLTPAVKALEGFLNRLADRKKLRKNKRDRVLGNIYGENNPRLKDKIQDKKLIKKVNATWEFCRNEVLHYRDEDIRFGSMRTKYEEIVEVMKEMYQDLYNKKSEADDEINSGFNKYVSSKFENPKYKIKQKIIRVLRKL